MPTTRSGPGTRGPENAASIALEIDRSRRRRGRRSVLHFPPRRGARTHVSARSRGRAIVICRSIDRSAGRSVGRSVDRSIRDLARIYTVGVHPRTDREFHLREREAERSRERGRRSSSTNKADDGDKGGWKYDIRSVIDRSIDSRQAGRWMQPWKIVVEISCRHRSIGATIVIRSGSLCARI